MDKSTLLDPAEETSNSSVKTERLTRQWMGNSESKLPVNTNDDRTDPSETGSSSILSRYDIWKYLCLARRCA